MKKRINLYISEESYQVLRKLGYEAEQSLSAIVEALVLATVEVKK